MSEEHVQGSPEGADPRPTAKTSHEAAQILANRKTELRQEAAEPPTPAVEPELTAEVAPNGHEPAEATEEVDYTQFDYSKAAGFTEPERETDQDVNPDGRERDFSFSYRGQEETVDLATAKELAELGRDYRTKTEDLGAQRRQLKSEREAFEAEMAEMRSRLQEEQASLASKMAKFSQELSPPDPSLAETDPDAFNLQMARYQRDRAELDRAEAEESQQRQAAREKAQREAQAEFTRQQEILHSRVPQMASQTVAHEVGRYLTQGLGFSGEELVRGWVPSADARFQEMAFKAWQLDTGRLKAKQLRAQPPKTVSGVNKRSGTPSGPSRKQGVAITPRQAADEIKNRRPR